MRWPMKSRGRSSLVRPLSLIPFLLALLPLALFAQPPARGGGPMGPGGGAMGENLLQMLESPAARALTLADSLGLSAEQRSSLTAMERSWTETHGDRIASLRSRLEGIGGQAGQAGEREAMRGRMQGGQAPLQGLMQEMGPLREGREAMLRDMAQILTAAQFQQLRSRLAPQRPGGPGQQAQAKPARAMVRGWMHRTDERLRRLEARGRTRE